MFTAIGASACYVGYRLVYRVPEFSKDGVGGFLLARLRGDPHDAALASFANRFAAIIGNENILQFLGVRDDNIPNRVLEQRLGLVSDPFNPLILVLPRRVGADSDAKAYAVSSKASMVLWGSSGPSGELKISVSFAPENSDVYELPGGVVGLIDVHEIQGTSVDALQVETFQRALAWLLAGYRKYHSHPPDYRQAGASFNKALNVLGNLPEQGVIGALKATLSLYAGNALLFHGQLVEAEEKYRDARRLSTTETMAMYIEPVNNLAYVERARGNSYPFETPGDGSSARQILETVTPQCEPGSQKSSMACTYVWYNLGATYHDEANVEDDDARARQLYVQAGERFNKSIQLLKPCQDAGFERTRCQLLLDSIQNQAYGLAKQAELNPNSTVDEIAAVSRKADEALAAARRLGIELPQHYRLTRARIRLMRREWKQAIEELKSLGDPGSAESTWPPASRAELHLLLAAAQKCGGQLDEAEASLVTYRQLAGSLPNPHLAQFREIREMPRLTRPCTDHAGTKSGGVP